MLRACGVLPPGVFAFGVMVEPGDDVAAWATSALARYGFALGADGTIVERTRDWTGEVGLRWRIEPPATFASRPWHAPTHACPFLAPLSAYVVIEPVWEDLSEYPELRLGLVRSCRGVVARLDDDRARQAVALLPFDLGRGVRKYGFDDGDAMLTREEATPYARDVLARVEAAARGAGLIVMISWMSTCHNPVRLMAIQLSGEKTLRPTVWRQDGGERPIDERALDGHEVEIWAYDFDPLFADAAFWERWPS